MSPAGATTDAVVRVGLDADFTIITAAEAKSRLVAALQTADTLELDVEPVAEMDTAGLQVLLLLAREARATGRAVRIVGRSSAVEAVLTLARIGPDLLPAGSAGHPEETS